MNKGSGIPAFLLSIVAPFAITTAAHADEPVCSTMEGYKPLYTATMADGKEAIVFYEKDDKRCIGYLTYSKGALHHVEETDAWVPTASLTRVSGSVPELKDWVGEWTGESATLKITAKGDKLVVEGDAIWVGTGESPNTGGFQGEDAPAGNHILLKDGECGVDLWKEGSRLYAADNSYCGGMNVRFNGIYQKGKPHG